MTIRTILLSLLLLVPGMLLCQVKFDDFFVDKTLRVDYYHVGNSTEETITLDHLYQQGIWAGNPKHLLDPLKNGRYRVTVYDVATNTMLFSKGFDSYFGEYKTTKPAKDGAKRTYHESVLIPYPKRPVLLVFETRDKRNLYRPAATYDVDPNDYHIITEAPQRGDQVYEVLKNGDPHDKVDLVILAEGYTAKEKQKYEKDLNRYTDIFFSMEPYKSLKERFNVYGVYSPSPQSGVDEPRQHSYRKTLLGASFNSLDSDRYLLIEDNKTLRDVAAQVPYDIIMVMVNSTRYGGGGFYGYYSTFTSDGTWNEYVFHHEFGHAFGGLADEYYTSDVAYDEFFPPGVEPVEPNITALLDPANLKWKDLVSPGLAIPTEWGQQVFDSLNNVRGKAGEEHYKKIERMKKEGASETDIKKAQEEFRALDRELGDKAIRFMEEHPLRGKVGAFEGAGFVPKGFYRSTVNSIMHQFNQKDKTFYRVNEEAIARVIDYYSR